jgi:3-deoxy-7-phosphoheptulonate synthase
MLIVMKEVANSEQIDNVLTFFRKKEIQVKVFNSDSRVIIEFGNEESKIDRKQILVLQGVDQVIHLTEPFKLVNSKAVEDDSAIDVDNVKIGGEEPVIIAGPCSVESERQIIETAWIVKEQGAHILRGGVFKPRTSPYSFQGLREKGLQFLYKAKQETGLPVVTEVVDTEDVPYVEEHVDILQIGSRNMQNYELLKAVGLADKPVLLKRSMSAKLSEFLLSAEYVMSKGNAEVILCERGIRTFVDHSRNTLDLSIVPAIKGMSNLPIIVDPSHATGRSDMIEPMSMAALAAGANGLMIEVHPDPEKSVSDANQALNPQQFSNLMHKVQHYIEWQKAYANTPSAY